MGKSAFYFKHFISQATILLLLIFGIIHANSFENLTTESPENVETFDPENWRSKAETFLTAQVVNLKVETRVRLRYARTRLTMVLDNHYNKSVQATFKIKLARNAFFSIFKLRRGRSPKYYTAKIVTREDAHNIFNSVHDTDGTVSAGLIGAVPNNKDPDADLVNYEMKFTLGPKVGQVQGYLVFERLLERIERKYCDEMEIYPTDFGVKSVDLLEISVDVEELENVLTLDCTEETKEYNKNCSSTMKRKNGKLNTAEIAWRVRNQSTSSMKRQPIGFCYELEHKNITSAVIVTETGGNFHFAHLFVPEDLPVIRKHIVFLLDVSDSMFGGKLKQLEWSMIEIFDHLKSEDFFNIITFSSETTVWSKYGGDRAKCPLPFPATEEFLDSARYFIREKMTAQGVTNMHKGLVKAFDLISLFSPFNDERCNNSINTRTKMKREVKAKLPEDVEPMIFLLTDGKPTTGIRSPKDLLTYVRDLNKKMEKPVQIHTVAYGMDADIPFLEALASDSGGITKIIQEDSGAGLELVTFYEEISSQVLTEIRNTYYSHDEEIMSSGNLISSPVFLVEGKEILNVYNLTKEMNRNVTSMALSLSPRSFHWETEIKGRNGFIQFETPVYDCISLGKTLPNCLDRIDFHLHRLQGYQLLKRYLEQDMYVLEGLSCPRSHKEEDMFNSWITDDYGDYLGDQPECVNPFKEKIIQLATQFGFVTPYTSLILTTGVQIDIGLLGGESSRPSKKTLLDKVTHQTLQDVPRAEKLMSSDLSLNISQPVYSKVILAETLEAKKTEEYSAAAAQTQNMKKWFTKLVRDFTVSFFSKIFQRRRKNQTLVNSSVAVIKDH